MSLSGLNWEDQCIFSTQSEIGLFPTGEESLYSDSVLHDIPAGGAGCETGNPNQSPEFPSKIGDFPTGENPL